MLIIMRGTTLSGKSSLCEQNLLKTATIESDHFRELICNNVSTQNMNKTVFDTLRQVLEHRLEARVNLTIIDATNLKYRDVKEYVKLAEKYFTPYYFVHVEPPSLEEMRERNFKRYKIQEKFIPEHVIERHYNTYHNNIDVFLEKDPEKNFIIEQNFAEEMKREFLDLVLELLNNHNDEYINKSVWCIGDVHGCYQELEELVYKIKEKDSDAKIIILGDLIDRGESLEKTFDVVFKHDLDFIMGNHEYKFIKEVVFGDTCRSKARQNSIDEFKSLSEDKQCAILDAMKNSKLVVKVKSNGKHFLLSHSGMTGDLYNYNVFNTAMNQKEVFEVEDFEKLYLLTYYQVYGHRQWEYTDIETQLKEKTSFNIDSGCVYGNKLTALHLNSLEYLQVDAKETYYVYNGK